MSKDDIQLHSLDFHDGSLNMELSGETVKGFYAILLQLFKDSGATNFLTVAIEHESDKYEITIRNCNGILTPAEKIAALEYELKKAK
jgi:hypothetical protein